MASLSRSEYAKVAHLPRSSHGPSSGAVTWHFRSYTLCRDATSINLLLLCCCAFLSDTALSGQSAKLPADVDPNTLSRLPLVLRSSLDANGQRIYDFMTSTFC